MKADATKASQEFKRNGITVRIRPTIKDGTEYFVCDYRVNGKRKLVWRSTMADARQAASDAVDRITEGQADVLQLTSTDAHTYLRARDALPPGVRLDKAAMDHAEVLQILAGRATPVEVARDWVKRNAVALPRISVADAVKNLKDQLKADGKSEARRKQIAAVLDRFAENIVGDVHTLTPTILSQYLSAMSFTEKTKKNHRDAIGFFSRWLVLHAYLAKGTDLLEGVQKYSGRKFGKITTYSPQEIAKLLIGAKQSDPRMIPSLALGAFAQMRTSEVARIDWEAIDFDDDGGNSKPEPQIVIASDITKNGEEGEADRATPMKANLRAWLEPYRKAKGKVCPFTEKQISKHWQRIAEAAGVPWQKNALRHTCISARIAECRDVPRVADESGNSPKVIRDNYRKVKFKERDAVLWFSITPENVAKVAAGEALPVVSSIVPLKAAA
jgi:integrase